MFRLSSIFRDVNEEYLVIPAIWQFFKQEGIKPNSSWDKENMLSEIESYANSDTNAEKRVQEWLDSIIVEGIKEIQIEFRPIKKEMAAHFHSADQIKTRLNAHLSPDLKRHLCGNSYSHNKYQFVKYKLENGAHGRVAHMYFCKKVHFAENKAGKLTVKVVDYPIIAQYYFDRSWLCIRFKARTGLYEFKESGYDTTSVRISASTETNTVLKAVENMLELEPLPREQNSIQIRRKLFILLDRYTHTPKEIEAAIDARKKDINDVITNTFNICQLEEGALPNVKDDVFNLMEKYFSIYWPDTSVFIQDREAYPIHLSAKDEESSQVDQRAGLNKPLQSRAVFFDNKRMLYQQQSCESIQFCWKKKSESGAQNSFPVKIYEDKGRCLFKFSRYTKEEDIENVLFSIIDAQ